ncbi:hypothetical protein ES707_19529 [subsurface metagenome]
MIYINGVAKPKHADLTDVSLDDHHMSIHEKLLVGKWFTPAPAVATADTTSLNADKLYVYPLAIARALTIDRLGLWVFGTAVGNARLGIYNDNGNVYPGSLLLDAGAVDTNGQGIKEIIINQALTKGLYWLAIICSAGITVYKGQWAFSPLGRSNTTLKAIYSHYYKNGVGYGALPDPCPAGAGLTTSADAAYSSVFAHLASLN